MRSSLTYGVPQQVIEPGASCRWRVLAYWAPDLLAS